MAAADPTVATAREKYSCPACGAEAIWTPAKQALICPFCGTESPATLEQRDSGTTIVEHDLVAALRAIPDEARGWHADKTAVRCQSCQAISVFDARNVGQRCEFCGSAALVPYQEIKEAFRPESLLPMRVSEVRARELIRTWYRRLWFAPNGVGSKAITDTVRGLYVPYWTFDARADARWTAESGTYYSIRVGKRTVRQVRWRPAAGELSHTFDDELVCASRGVHPGRMRAIEPFPTHDLIPYDPGYLAGWTVERYQIDLVNAAQRSRQQMDATLRRLCEAQVPGDTHRNLHVDAAYSEQRFKHILAPIWLLTYVYGTRSYQVVINGVTGEVAGERPWSWVKLTLLALAILALLIVWVNLQN